MSLNILISVKIMIKNIFHIVILIIAVNSSIFKEYAYPQSDSIKASLGILIYSSLGEKMATFFDRIKSGDSLQIFIQPQSNLEFFLFHSDQTKAELIFETPVKSNAAYILPAFNEFYQFDGLLEKESLILLLSKKDNKQIQNITEEPDPVSTLRILDELIRNSRSLESEKTGPEIRIGGNVRDAYVHFKKLKTYSSDNVIIKKFTFHVKK